LTCHRLRKTLAARQNRLIAAFDNLPASCQKPPYLFIRIHRGFQHAPGRISHQTQAYRMNCSSNIEPLAREIATRLCRQTSPAMTAPEIAAWVDAHWPCAAAELEAGILNDDGSRVPGAHWELGLAAYRERRQ
jgi:hypothetical protein